MALYRTFSTVTIHSNVFLFGFGHGDTQLFIWDKPPEDVCEKLGYTDTDYEKMLMKLDTNKLNDHNEGMTCSDFHEELKIYVTGGLDQYVRVFNLKKELLKEVLFPQPV